jgi:hypothetical protein
VTEEEPQRSLLGGRRTRPLTEAEIRNVVNTFLSFDRTVPTEHDEGRPTSFRLVPDEENPESEVRVGRVFFSADVYPGPSVADPNSELSMPAAVAHELCHYYRWLNNTELPHDEYRDLDEAQTSLEALLRFGRDLSRHEVEQLARDAVVRLQRLRAVLLPNEEDPGDEES